MAILSLQLVFSMVVASMLSKMTGHLSFARWVLCGGFLMHYLHPSDEEIRQSAGIAQKPPPKFRKGGGKEQTAQLSIPKSTPIQLDSAPIKKHEVLPLNYYTEYQWLLDFAVCGIFVYGMTEAYYTFLPSTEFNLSIMWCLLVTGFALKVMFSLTKMYFRTDDSGERILCIVFGLFFLVMAMGIVIIDEDKLEFGLEQAYNSFDSGAHEFLQKRGIESSGPASRMTFRIILVIIAAFLGAFLTFPGLRLAKMHSDSLRYAEGRPFLRTMLHSNIVAPLLVSIMWVKPVMRDLMVKGTERYGRYLISNETFEVIRLLLVYWFIFFRFTLLWTHLQAHLNMAVDRVNALRRESGRITVGELQKMIVRVFYYLCVVALQYIAPLVLLLYLTFMLKTMGNFSFSGAFNIEIPILRNQTAATSVNITTDADISTTAKEFTLALEDLREVFTPLWFRGILSFLIWWVCTSWFVTSAFGMVYYSYFTAV